MNKNNFIAQQTIRRSFSFSGIGLHSGLPCSVILYPSVINSGISFIVRGRQVFIDPMLVDWQTPRSTSILACGGDGAITTVEHLLAALVGLEIDNIIIEVIGGEVPILDGSALEFVEKLQSVGLSRQNRPRRYLEVLRPVEYRNDLCAITIAPASALEIEATIDFDHPSIGQQVFRYCSDPAIFGRELAPARTFGFVSELPGLQSRKLARGARLSNVIALDEQQVCNSEGLRFPDEFVRHKVLDIIGDLAFAGSPILARFVSHCGGHTANNQVLRQLLGRRGEPDSWRYVTKNDLGEITPYPSCQSLAS